MDEMELKTLEYFFQVFAMFSTQIFLCTQYILQESEILKNKIFEGDQGENMLIKKREKIISNQTGARSKLTRANNQL